MNSDLMERKVEMNTTKSAKDSTKSVSDSVERKLGLNRPKVQTNEQKLLDLIEQKVKMTTTKG